MSFIEIGIISEIRGARARVKIDEMVTDFLPVMQLANSFACAFSPIRVGEQVVVLPVRGSINAGVVLRSVYYEAHDAPTTDTKSQTCVFEDGVRISYDTGASTLSISAPKLINIECERVNLRGNFEVQGDIHASGTIIDDGGNTPNHSH